MLDRRREEEFAGTGLSYWQRTGGSPQPGEATRPSLSPPARAEFVIVGAGLAGLSTALRILDRRPGADVVVLEARFAGYGASGRNGGLMSPLAAPAWLITAAREADHAWGLGAINAHTAAAAAWAASLAPDAEVRRCELALQAKGPLTDAGLREVSRAVGAAGIRHDLVAGGRYRAAEMRIAAHTVHPYRLVAGLARAARAAGVRIFEQCPVARIDDAGAGGATLELGAGRRMLARTVVVCANAYTPSLRLLRPPRAKAVFNYMLASAPLPAQAVARLIPGGGFAVELDTAYAFWRVHDGRIVYGGLERLKPMPDDRDIYVPRRIAASLERHLALTLGGANELPAITDHWGGKYHVTATDLPVIRRAEAGSAIVFNVGYGGEGVALTMALAPLAAAVAVDEAPRDAEIARLQRIIAETRVPVAGMARFAARVAARVGGGLAARLVGGRNPLPPAD